MWAHIAKYVYGDSYVAQIVPSGIGNVYEELSKKINAIPEAKRESLAAAEPSVPASAPLTVSAPVPVPLPLPLPMLLTDSDPICADAYKTIPLTPKRPDAHAMDTQSRKTQAAYTPPSMVLEPNDAEELYTPFTQPPRRTTPYIRNAAPPAGILGASHTQRNTHGGYKFKSA